MNWIAQKSAQFFITLFVLIAISALPSLVVQLEFVPSNYWNGIQQQFSQLAKLDEITYYNVTAQRELPLLPDLAPLMKETVIIFMTSLIVSVGFALLYAYFFYRSGKRVRTVLQQTSQTLEMIPDLFWLIFSQFLAITIYKKTGFDRIEVAGGFAEYIRFLSVVVSRAGAGQRRPTGRLVLETLVTEFGVSLLPLFPFELNHGAIESVDYRVFVQRPRYFPVRRL